MDDKIRMEDRLIEELVIEVAGEDVVQLINLIIGKRNVNEFKIADKLGITVNQVRNMLYRLGAHNLVDFTRKKDKRKGWYIYYWTFDLKKAHDLILMLKHKKLFYLKQRIEKEKQDVYLKCVNDCVRFDTNHAMEYDFRCPECGELLIREDAEKIVANIKKQISQIKLDIEEEEKRIIKEPRKKAVKVKKKPKRKHLKQKRFGASKSKKILRKPKKKFKKRFKPKKKKFKKRFKPKNKRFKPKKEIIKKKIIKTKFKPNRFFNTRSKVANWSSAKLKKFKKFRRKIRR